MDEIQKNPNLSGLNELERIFQEYKSKLEDAEKDANEITDSAWKRAEKIIDDKQKEAQQIADDITRKAKQEADRIIWEAKSRATEIEREATEKARKEAKERTKREGEKLITDIREKAEQEAAETIDRAQKKAEGIIKKEQESARLQIFKEAETMVAEAKQRAKKVDEDSIARADENSKLITEASQKAHEIMSRIMGQLQTELNDLATMFNRATDELELKSVLEKTEIGANDNKTDDNSKFKGLRELSIRSPYNRTQIKRLVDSLKQIPSIKLEGESGTEEEFSIFVNIVEPIPLQNILQELSIVESSDVRGDKIKLNLRHIDD